MGLVVGDGGLQLLLDITELPETALQGLRVHFVGVQPQTRLSGTLHATYAAITITVDPRLI